MATFDPTKQIMTPYDMQVAQAKRRQDLAEMLTKQGLEGFNGPSGQMVSGHFVANSPLKYLASGLQAFAGLQAGKGATEDIAGAATKRQSEIAQQISEAMKKAQGTPVSAGDEGPVPAQPGDLMGAAQTAATSPYPEVRSLAEALTKQNSDVFKTASGRATPESVALSGGDPRKLKTFQPSPPMLKKTPDGAEYFEIVDPVTGKTTVTTVGRPPQVRVDNSVRMGDKKEMAAVEHVQKLIEKERPEVEGSMKSLQLNSQVLFDLENGVKTGPETAWQQPLRQIMSAMGFKGDDRNMEDVAATANTLKHRILSAVGGKLGAQISDGDRKFIESMSGNELMNPNTLRRVIAIDSGITMQRIDRFNKQYDTLIKLNPELADVWGDQKLIFNMQAPASQQNNLDAAVSGRPLPPASALTSGKDPGGAPIPGQGSRPAPGAARRRLRFEGGQFIPVQ